MILVNGTEHTEISVLDRGLQYGDGVFETLLIQKGMPRWWSRYMARLQRDCQRLGIEAVDEDMLAVEARHVCKDIELGVLKIILTRGTGSRGYRPPAPGAGSAPTRILMTFPFPEYPASYWQQGVAVRICRTRLGMNPVLAGIKHLNRLEQVLARQEWHDPHIAEGLMLDSAGHLVEGTMTNLFLVRGHTLMTPDLSNCGVAGIMREIVLEAVSGMELASRVSELELEDLELAEEIFVCNSVIGIWPVRAVNERVYAPGAVTRAIAARVSSMM